MCSEFLDAAASIGRQIVAEAIWHRGLCSWVGAVPDPGELHRTEYRALDPDLYGGTAGVGLFLAHLAAATGAEPIRVTALGAVRHALARGAVLPPARRHGFQGGAPGIAWAAVRAAELLGEEELRASAPAVLRDAGAAERLDLMTGAAGTALALPALAEALDDPRLEARALAAGETLLVGGGFRHRCGLAHGAAGIACALLALYEVTGDERFRVAGTAALGYERSRLTSDSWPDPRLGLRHRPAMSASTITGTWCHGEPGIALSRLLAIEVLGPGTHDDDAEVALEATRRSLSGSLPFALEDLSLCHGACGAAEALLVGAATLGGRWREASGLAEDLGRVAIERHASAWPCGIVGAVTPGLFLGLSGIAWTFLRLQDRATPSPLELPRGRRRVDWVDTAPPQAVGSADHSTILVEEA